MINNYTAFNNIISKAAAEAGIREGENFRAVIIGVEGDTLEFVLRTEWTTVTCYAELGSGRIIGLMSESVTATYPKAA